MKPGDRPRYSRPNLRVRCIDASDVHDVLIKGAIYLAHESANAEMYIVNGRSFLRTRFEPVTDVLPEEDIEDIAEDDIPTVPELPIAEKKAGE